MILQLHPNGRARRELSYEEIKARQTWPERVREELNRRKPALRFGPCRLPNMDREAIQPAVAAVPKTAARMAR